MTIEEASIHFLESQMSGSYKEIFDKYLITDVEWLEMGNILRAYAHIEEATTNKVLNIIVLFPPFKIAPETK